MTIWFGDIRFPGPGLGIRIIGEVTEEKLNILRQADKIFIDELRNHGLYREVSQAFAALLPNQFVGVVGDRRADSYAVVLRAVKTLDFMTAVAYKFEDDFWTTVSSRIGNEVPQCCRVFEEKNIEATSHHRNAVNRNLILSIQEFR